MSNDVFILYVEIKKDNKHVKKASSIILFE